MSPQAAASQQAPPFPWSYAYEEDGPRLNRVVLRPIVPIVALATDMANPVYALVDSGCEHVLAAPSLANDVGIDIDRVAHQELSLGIGGENVRVLFVDLTLRLLSPSGNDDEYVEWGAEVGFPHHWRPTWPMLVGQNGFLDCFTATFSRHCHMLTIEDWDAYENRFEVPAYNV